MKLEQWSLMAERMEDVGEAGCCGVCSGAGGLKVRATQRQQVALAVGSATETGEAQREQGTDFIG